MTGSPEAWSARMRRFADAECRGSSPLYEVLARSVSTDDELLRWLAAAAGPRANPNLLFAAVHDLLLRDPGSDPLARFYPSLGRDSAPPHGAYTAFREFWKTHRAALTEAMAHRTTQTNEPARSGYLLPAFCTAFAVAGGPLAIVDVGTAAGINLLFDHFRISYRGGVAAGPVSASVRIHTESRGRVPPADGPLVVADRVGVDLAPLDPADEDAARWLEACVWPEHTDRLANLRAALAEVRRVRPPVLAGNAVDLLPAVLGAIPVPAIPTIAHTNVLPYFSPEETARFASLLADAGRARTVAWVAAETPGLLRAAGFSADLPAFPGDPAAIPLVLSVFRDGVRTDRFLAHTGAHGRWLDWTDDPDGP